MQVTTKKRVTRWCLLLALVLMSAAWVACGVSHPVREENTKRDNTPNDPLALPTDTESAGTAGSTTAVLLEKLETDADSKSDRLMENEPISKLPPSTHAAGERAKKSPVPALAFQRTAKQSAGGVAAPSPTADTTCGVARPAMTDEVWVIVKPAVQPDQQASPPPGDEYPTPGSGCVITTIPDGKDKTKIVPVPLEHTSVRANVAGYVGAVDVVQRFHNPFSSKIEAVYVFPLPENAAVNEFIMTIGDRRIRGVIRERQEAEKVYTEARNQGYVASLLTQERPNVFTQKVANIEPGKRIDVNIRYYQTLRYDDGWYEFSFPMVVGPRYNPASVGDRGIGAAPRDNPGASGQKVEAPYLKPNERSGHDIDLTVTLDAGVKIEDITSNSHRIKLSHRNGSRATTTLQSDDTIPNKDFVLRWRVAGDTIKANFLTHTDERGGYFTLMVYPPADLGSLKREPMEMIFIIDVSGSMSGEPIKRVKQAMRAALAKIDPRDTFQVITFAGAATPMTPAPIAVTPENIDNAMNFIDRSQAGGGTEMLKGIRAAITRNPGEDKRRLVALMTDGYIGNEQEIISAIAGADPSIRFFSFGVGSSVNRYLIEGVARAGRGAVAYIHLNDDPSEATSAYIQRVSHPAMTDLNIQIPGATITEMFPKQLPDLFVGRPVAVVGRFNNKGRTPAAARITGRAGGAEFQTSAPHTDTTIMAASDISPPLALPSLWARAKIADLADYAPADQGNAPQTLGTIKKLAIDYSLMSNFTAFVAVDASRRTDGDTGTTVTTPLPVPEGVAYETTVGPARE